MSAFLRCENCGMSLAGLQDRSRQKFYNPPPLSPPFLATRAKAFVGGWGGGVQFEAPHGRNFNTTPPLLYTPHPPLEGYFQGWGVGPPDREKRV